MVLRISFPVSIRASEVLKEQLSARLVSYHWWTADMWKICGCLPSVQNKKQTKKSVKKKQKGLSYWSDTVDVARQTYRNRCVPPLEDWLQMVKLFFNLENVWQKKYRGGWSAQTLETYRGREDSVPGSRGYRGIWFQAGSQRRERKPEAEGRLCGQTLTDALGTVLALSASAQLASGVSPVCHTPVCPTVQRFLCECVCVWCVSYLQDTAVVHIRETSRPVQPQNQVLARETLPPGLWPLSVPLQVSGFLPTLFFKAEQAPMVEPIRGFEGQKKS